MIGTIGFLVQDTSNRRRWRVWLLATSLYTLACLGSALLLGALLGALGRLVQSLALASGLHLPVAHADIWLVGVLALAYAASDAGWPRLPRPILMAAVPITWWRAWRPYGAALAYGAALGAGVFTRVPFGAFYVLCAWCASRGDPVYGALLMGAYGAARALVMFPASWGVYRHRMHVVEWLSGPLFDLDRARRVLAVALVAFGALALASAFLIR
jgi:sulfite exporter TauE/SafE